MVVIVAGGPRSEAALMGAGNGAGVPKVLLLLFELLRPKSWPPLLLRLWLPPRRWLCDPLGRGRWLGSGSGSG